MKLQTTFLTLTIAFLLFSCNKNNVKKIDSRNFKMGFSTWSYGPSDADIDANYDLIKANGDIYSEQVDDLIPWNSWINGTALPAEFIANIDSRISQLSTNHEVLLSISPLNMDRDDLIEDMDGSGKPTYTALNDTIIEDAYYAHVTYLIDRFNPNYLVVAMESNDLYTNSPEKWEEFKLLMGNIRSRLKTAYPTLKIAESITLHNWYKPEVDNPETYIEEVKTYINNFDFAAISHYAFFKGHHTKNQMQKAFDFLHDNVSKPIAFVETTHLAESLDIPAYEIKIESDEKEQADYAETLLANAERENYLFVIWWSFRDYDKLWETFPEDVKDIGKLWRDTGLQDENGNNRPAYDVWKSVFEK